MSHDRPPTRPSDASGPQDAAQATASGEAPFALVVVLLPRRALIERPFPGWAAGLVLVASGAVELIWESGASRRFGPGSMIVLTPLDVRAVRACAAQPSRLLSLERCPGRSREGTVAREPA